MSQEKKRRGRRAHLDDFHKTASGEYVYEGQLHHYRAGALTLRQALARLWALAAVMAAGAVAAGCVPAAGVGSCPYVLLPYAAGLMAVVSVVWLMCRLTAGGDPLRDYVYRATVGRARLRSALALAFAAAALAGELVYLLLHGVQGRLPGTIAFLACQGAVLAASLAWNRLACGLEWTN